MNLLCYIVWYAVKTINYDLANREIYKERTHLKSCTTYYRGIFLRAELEGRIRKRLHGIKRNYEKLRVYYPSYLQIENFILTRCKQRTFQRIQRRSKQRSFVAQRFTLRALRSPINCVKKSNSISQRLPTYESTD